MSRRISFIVSSGFVLSIILYLGYNSKLMEETFNDYMYGYFDEPQKYLYLITVFIIPYLLCLQKPVFKSLIIIRLRENVFYYILKEGFIFSLFISSVVFFAFIFSGIIIGINFVFKLVWISLWIKAFLFTFSCYILSFTVYLLFDRIILGILSVLILNFTILIIIYAVDFYMMTNTMSDETLTIIFYLYILFIFVAGIIFLYKGVKTKECLK